MTQSVSAGGAYRVAIEETRSLQKSGFQTTLISLIKPINPWNELLNEIRVRYVADSNFLTPLASEIINRNLFVLRKITDSYDIILSHGLPCTYLASKSYRNTTVRKIPYIHDPIEFTLPGNIFSLLFGKFSSLKRKFALAWLKGSEIILVNSKRSQNRLKEEIGLESKVLYPTIAHPADTLPGRRQDFFVSVGRIGLHPTYPILLKILEEVKEMRLTIAGSWSYSTKSIIEMFSRDSTIKKRVKFLVGPSDTDLKNLYQSARAFLYPGIENFNMSALEAASNGCPVIISKETGICEILDNYSLVASQEDTPAFIQMVRSLLYDENKSLTEGKKVYDLTRKFDSHYHMTNLIRFLNKE